MTLLKAPSLGFAQKLSRRRICRGTLAGDTKGDGRWTLYSHRIPELRICICLRMHQQSQRCYRAYGNIRKLGFKLRRRSPHRRTPGVLMENHLHVYSYYTLDVGYFMTVYGSISLLFYAAFPTWLPTLTSKTCS